MVLCGLFSSFQLCAREVVVGIEMKPQRKIAFMFTPVVLPDLISAKAAFEYRLHRKINLVIPIESKWMDYRWAIKMGGSLFGQRDDLPEYLYRPNAAVKPKWDIDYAHFKISSGAGIKYFPFSESMMDGFFLKTIFMAGVENFEAFHAEDKRISAVFTHAFTLGYTWVKGRNFALGFEVGEEWSMHTNPIDNLARPFAGFMPVLQFNLGFYL